MEWKIISGQICLTAITITCIAFRENSGIVLFALGALAGSVGLPAVLAAKKD